MRGRAVLRDGARGEWLEFANPRAIVTAAALGEVVPALERAEAWANDGGYAVGFIAYEAAPALDPALETHSLHDFPLVWFGLYDVPSILSASDTPLAQAPTHLAEPPTDWIPNVSRATYDAAIARVRDHIARGDTYQVNYTLRLNARPDEDAWALFRRLVRAQPNSYAAFVDTGRYAIASASPELFLRREGARLTTLPMKGTAPRGRFPREDRERADRLWHSEKNRAENVMIVDMARNDLGRIARVGSVSVPHLWQIERYPTVWQMTSTVTAESDASFVEILRATFPAASITGAPKRRTMQLIAALEAEPRRVYTGAIGYLAPQRRAQFNVAIRTAVVDRQTRCAQYGVGGGIVWDSEAGDEYSEVRHKARVLTEPAREFSLLESLRWTPEEGFWLLDEHLRRLRASADYFDYPFEQARIVQALEGGVRALPPTVHKVRLLLARDGSLSVSAAPIQPPREPVRLALARTPVDSNARLLFHKTTRREVYDAALAERGGADDVLLWNERGELTETCTSNIVLQVGDEYFTPPIECGLLGGTLRAALLDEGKLVERVLRLEDVPRADALYRINSVRGWQKVTLEPTAHAVLPT